MADIPITTSDLAPLLAALTRAREISQLYLRFGIKALGTKGAGGRIIIHIPRDPKDPVEVEFHGSPKEDL